MNKAMSSYKNDLKMTYREFNDKVYKWYNETRPMSGKPRPHLISKWYDDYLNGADFKFL
jgi:hypothetical protein